MKLKTKTIFKLLTLTGAISSVTGTIACSQKTAKEPKPGNPIANPGDTSQTIAKKEELLDFSKSLTDTTMALTPNLFNNYANLVKSLTNADINDNSENYVEALKIKDQIAKNLQDIKSLEEGKKEVEGITFSNIPLTNEAILLIEKTKKYVTSKYRSSIEKLNSANIKELDDFELDKLIALTSYALKLTSSSFDNMYPIVMKVIRDKYILLNRMDINSLNDLFTNLKDQEQVKQFFLAAITELYESFDDTDKTVKASQNNSLLFPFLNYSNPESDIQTERSLHIETYGMAETIVDISELVNSVINNPDTLDSLGTEKKDEILTFLKEINNKHKGNTNLNLYTIGQMLNNDAMKIEKNIIVNIVWAMFLQKDETTTMLKSIISEFTDFFLKKQNNTVLGLKYEIPEKQIPIFLNENYTAIMEEAFKDKKVSYVYAPYVEKIGKDSLNTEDIRNVFLPKVTYLGENAIRHQLLAEFANTVPESFKKQIKLNENTYVSVDSEATDVQITSDKPLYFVNGLFKNNENINTVTITSTQPVYISEEMFKHSTLRSITIQAPEVYIANEAFADTPALETFDVQNVQNMGEYALFGSKWYYDHISNSNEEQVKLGSVLIGYKNINNKTEIILDPSITQIYNSAFSFDNKIPEAATANEVITSIAAENVKSLNQGSFGSLSNLTSLNLPNLTSLGATALQGTPYYYNILNDQESTKAMLGKVLIKLKSDNPYVTLSDDVEFIYTTAFKNSNQINSIQGENVKGIASNTFANGFGTISALNFPNLESVGSSWATSISPQSETPVLVAPKLNIVNKNQLIGN
ncbi:leucine-rich repeat protein [Mycoplasma sp. 4404]|uniref:leucine-rich repeat protein n=1 Tax=Mycoplasma sp. 4404 TaxID=3108530 RepID=UPI002B1E219A|nr:leucine-rich repeat protein [Mycoplasma sp. 4404]MEA4162755.1 leucine-rich repeat protein [Mycoplasma sp. 4404]